MTAPERFAALQALDDAYLQCRGYGHQWTVRLSGGAVVPPDLFLRLQDDMPPEIRAAVRKGTAAGGERVQPAGWRTELKVCLRSGSTVLRLWDRGDLIYEKRTWEDGYLLPAGLEEHEHYLVEAQRELWRRILTTNHTASAG